MEKRSPEWLRQEAAARGLRVGGKVNVECREKMEDGRTTRKFFRSGQVTGLYPYIFACEVGGVTECFRYNQLIGNEAGERVVLGG